MKVTPNEKEKNKYIALSGLPHTNVSAEYFMYSHSVAPNSA